MPKRVIKKLRQNQYFDRVYLMVENNAFLKSSGIIFVVNIAAAILNYSIPIITRNITEKDFFPSWIALNSTVAITMVVFFALQAEFTKKTSSYAKISEPTAKIYLEFIRRGLLKVFLAALPLSPILIYLVHIVSPSESWLLSITIVGNLFFQAYAVLHSSFLMGLLNIKEFSINLLLATTSRPVTTTLMLLAGWGLYALPLGYVGFAIIMFAHAWWVISRLKLKDQTPEESQMAMKGGNETISSNRSSTSQSSSRADTDQPLLPLSRGSENSYREEVQEKELTTNFSLKQEVFNASKTLFVFFTLAAFLNASAIISERTLSDQDRDLFAVLFTFGQIIHFGAIAFLGAFVAYSAKGRNLKIYLTSVAAVTLITISIGLGFWLFGPMLLWIMNSPEYISQIPIILYFSLFVAFYNVIFVSAQYLISLSDYKTIASLILFLVVLVVILFNPAIIGLEAYTIFSFISVNLVIALIAATGLTIKTVWDHSNKGVATGQQS